MSKPKAEIIADLMTAWDEMDRATQRLLTSLPSQVSENANELNRVRLECRAVFQCVTLALS